MNNITFETFKMALILLPGFTWSLIWMKYSKNKPQTDKFYFVVYAIVASTFNYLVYFLLEPKFNDFDGDFINLLDNNIKKKDLFVISITSIISIITAIIFSFGSHWSPILKLRKWLNISLNDGEYDVLVATTHKHMKLGKLSLIRLYDLGNNRIYQGLITKISDPQQQMEFLISDCDIYDNNTGKFLLSMKELYLNINSNNILIEFIRYEK